jgi:hypothetical protein
MYNLLVQIVRLVEDYQPPIVESQFEDAEGTRHAVVDKAPVLGGDYTNAPSRYPQVGFARCEVLARWRDSDGRDLVRITIDRPDGLESTRGLSEFVVLSTSVFEGTEAPA